MNEYRSIILIAVCGLLTQSGCTPDDASAARTAIRADASWPNVLLISVDMLRPDHLGCYGYTRETSPRIDRLASEGTLFENAISSAPWTLPAHASLFTGLTDSAHGCVDTNRSLAPELTTIAERLKAIGYATVGFFSGPYLHPVFGLAQGFDEYIDCTSYSRLSDKTASSTGTVEGQAIWGASHSDVTNPRVYKAVQEWMRRSDRRPFFMFVHMWDVHYDFTPPKPYDRKFDPDYQGPFDGSNFFFDQWINARMDKRDLEHLIALYDGEIAWTDHYIGRILDDLDALGLRDSTVVVLVADHGTEFFEHGEKSHRKTLFDEVIKIPMIVRYPGRVPSGKRIAAQTSIIDVTPTILELIGLSTPKDVMGHSLVPLFSGGSFPPNRVAVSELASLGRKMKSFRRRDWKLIRDEVTGRSWIYDLHADPEELHPLQDPDSPMVKAIQRAARLAEQRLTEAAPSPQSPDNEAAISPEVLEKLRSLGYVGNR